MDICNQSSAPAPSYLDRNMQSWCSRFVSSKSRAQSCPQVVGLGFPSEAYPRFWAQSFSESLAEFGPFRILSAFEKRQSMLLRGDRISGPLMFHVLCRGKLASQFLCSSGRRFRDLDNLFSGLGLRVQLGCLAFRV